MKNKFLNISSIAQKLTMGIAGAFLMLFLVIHLYINLQMLKGDNGVTYLKSVEFMTTNPVIKIIEIVLFLALFTHILLGITLKIYNWAARPVRYHYPQKSQTSFFGKYMIWTGLTIGIFLLIHFYNFFFVKLGFVAPPEGIDKHNFYEMSKIVFKQPLYSYLYIVLIAIGCLHLYHAFQSFFQTIGFQHNRYFKYIKIFGAIYAIGIAIGFCIIPLYFLYFL